MRTAVLIDEADITLGTCSVPDLTFAIKHGGEVFVRTETGCRLLGGGVGVVFRCTDLLVREHLNPFMPRRAGSAR